MSREVSTTLNREIDVQATLPAGPSTPGSRGEPITAGMVLMTFLSSGTAAALIHTLRSFFDRDRTLEIEIDRGDGKAFRLTGENVSAAQIDRTIDLAREFLDSPS